MNGQDNFYRDDGQNSNKSLSLESFGGATGANNNAPALDEDDEAAFLQNALNQKIDSEGRAVNEDEDNPCEQVIDQLD